MKATLSNTIAHIFISPDVIHRTTDCTHY